MNLLEAMGGEDGCRRLAHELYSRIAKDAVLRPLFPGKSVRCATEEFGDFLIQFLGGDEAQTQHRWWLSLRESHARFRIDAAQRSAWMKNMQAALEAMPVSEAVRGAFRDLFLQGSGYVIGKPAASPGNEELAGRWAAQLRLDDAVRAIVEGRDADAAALASQFAHRASVFVGLLARMMQSQRPALVSYAVEAVTRDAGLMTARFGGRALLHYASAAGCVEVVVLLLRSGADANVADRGGHPPLYRVANECASEAGPRIVKLLAEAGADVNAQSGVTRATALHMAARRGFVETARALLECGARMDLRDTKGDTALDRARNCRRQAVVRLFQERGARG